MHFCGTVLLKLYLKIQSTTRLMVRLILPILHENAETMSISHGNEKRKTNVDTRENCCVRVGHQTDEQEEDPKLQTHNNHHQYGT